MTELEKSYRLSFLGLIGLLIMLIVILLSSCSSIPHILEGSEIQAYIDSNRAKSCSEYTVKVAYGTDSVIYTTYWTDKAVWYRLK